MPLADFVKGQNAVGQVFSRCCEVVAFPEDGRVRGCVKVGLGAIFGGKCHGDPRPVYESCFVVNAAANVLASAREVCY